MNPAKPLLIVAVLAVAIAGVWFALGSGQNQSAPLQQNAPIDSAPADPDPVEPQVAERTTRTETPSDATPRRQAVGTAAADGSGYDQGLEGRLVDEYGRPVPGAEVFLFEGAGASIFTQMMQAQQGIVKPPLAQAVSDPTGHFRLGVREIEPGQMFELRAFGEQHGDVTRPNLTLFDGKWWDAGDIAMPTGLAVFGRVVDSTTGRPIADATVYVKPANQTLVVSPTPGRERGIETRTDPTGHYRIENAGSGIYTVGAVAPGYAQDELANVHIKADTDNRFDFELSTGVSIEGVVTDPEGQPIPGAKIVAHAISSKKPLTVETRTDDAGRFALIGLIEGPYQLMLNAAGFVASEEKPILAPAQQEQYVMERQGKVRVRVIASNNRQIRNYNLFVKGYVVAQETISNLPHIPKHEVDARDLDDEGYYTVSGLDPDKQYKVEVFSKGYAKAFSEPFEIVRGGPPPAVTVRLTDGGVITGTVLGESGEPLRGVVVKTLPNDFQDNALMAMFGPMIPYKITRMQVRTNAQGEFRLQKLMPETYQLQFSHDDHYTVSVQDNVVEEGQTLQLGQVQMRRGALLTGSAIVDGQPAAQVKVTVTSKVEPGSKQGATFSATTVTDADGRFTLPKRLPPGMYMAQAGRQGGANIFLAVLDYKQTQTEFQITPGMTQHQLTFTIVSSPALNNTGR